MIDGCPTSRVKVCETCGSVGVVWHGHSVALIIASECHVYSDASLGEVLFALSLCNDSGHIVIIGSENRTISVLEKSSDGRLEKTWTFFLRNRVATAVYNPESLKRKGVPEFEPSLVSRCLNEIGKRQIKSSESFETLKKFPSIFKNWSSLELTLGDKFGDLVAVTLCELDLNSVCAAERVLSQGLDNPKDDVSWKILRNWFGDEACPTWEPMTWIKECPGLELQPEKIDDKDSWAACGRNTTFEMLVAGGKILSETEYGFASALNNKVLIFESAKPQITKTILFPDNPVLHVGSPKDDTIIAIDTLGRTRRFDLTSGLPFESIETGHHVGIANVDGVELLIHSNGKFEGVDGVTPYDGSFHLRDTESLIHAALLTDERGTFAVGISSAGNIIFCDRSINSVKLEGKVGRILLQRGEVSTGEKRRKE